MACTAEGDQVSSDEYRGLPVFVYEDLEATYPPGEFDLYVAVGYRKLNTIRARIFENAKARGNDARGCNKTQTVRNRAMPLRGVPIHPQDAYSGLGQRTKALRNHK